jgi:hypothetical protein
MSDPRVAGPISEALGGGGATATGAMTMRSATPSVDPAAWGRQAARAFAAQLAVMERAR